MTRFAMDSTEARAREDAFLGPPTPLSNDEIQAFKQAMLCHHPDATVAEESIAWRLWQSAWSEGARAGRERLRRERDDPEG